MVKLTLTELRKMVQHLLHHPDWMVRSWARAALDAKGAEARRLCNRALEAAAESEARI